MIININEVQVFRSLEVQRMIFRSRTLYFYFELEFFTTLSTDHQRLREGFKKK